MQMFHQLNLNRISSIYEATNVKLLNTAFFGGGLIDSEKVKKTEKLKETFTAVLSVQF